MMDLDRLKRCILFDWGDTLMRVFPEYEGPMYSWPRVETLPYAEDVLSQLRPTWYLAVATNAADSKEGEIWNALARVGLDVLIDKIYCARSVGHRKPACEFFDFILRDLNLDRTDVVMIGDDFKVDVRGANEYGLCAIWYNGTSDARLSGERFRTIFDLREVPEALEVLNPK